MKRPENNNEKHSHRKTVYKETEDFGNNKPDTGDTSSAGDFSRTDFFKNHRRTNKPMGSSHEPGTFPGR